jgi:hypothetical protein
MSFLRSEPFTGRQLRKDDNDRRNPRQAQLSYKAAVARQLAYGGSPPLVLTGSGTAAIRAADATTWSCSR